MIEKTKEFYEKLKHKFKVLKIIFSVISILMMLLMPIFSIIRNKGNLYINITVLIISLIYSVFWLALGTNKKYKMNRIYKWSKILLSTVSLGINVYSVYITAGNFSISSLIITCLMFISWAFNVVFNILYDVVSYKLNKFVTIKKEELNALKENTKEEFNVIKDKIITKKDEKLLSLKNKFIHNKNEVENK